ncbi:hypothetical protein N9769_07495 [Ascidiaceihabitans sp.]|nr:hypothetical protein [Ascidiaceihabitans sp.]MDB4212184.1 hypothetical protein [Ascidiaceihabitans sp.]
MTAKDTADRPISNLRKKFLHSMLRAVLLERGEEAFQIHPKHLKTHRGRITFRILMERNGVTTPEELYDALVKLDYLEWNEMLTPLPRYKHIIENWDHPKDHV